MKKYFYSILIMAIFAFGFAASSDSGSSTSKSPEEQKQEKFERMKKSGYERGYEYGFSSSNTAYEVNTKDDHEYLKKKARDYFIGANVGAPKNDEEKDLCNIYIEEFIKGYEDGYKNQ